MKTDFKKASELSSLLAKDYAEAFFRLLVVYQDLSASEAASRLDLHVKTAQDFLEGLEQQGIVSKKEVSEQKRPYFRYSLERKRLSLSVDLSLLMDENRDREMLNWRIREKKNSGALFKTSGKKEGISGVFFFVGKGRSRSMRKISLTRSQGRFLFHLPFPTEPAACVRDIIHKAGVEDAAVPETLDVMEGLAEFGIIEKE